MRKSAPASLVLLSLLLAPRAALAQASITGTVRDTSGGVLPGVTVEASSPVLIEKVRTVTTDGAGLYRIVDLRPGEYTVIFTLPGFSTVRRDGVVLEGAMTATINVELRVGALEETVTVTGESPIIDVQSVRRQVVMDNEIISAIPSSRSYNNLIQLMPNTITQAGAATNVQVVPGMVVFGGAGGRSNEGRVNVDGISVGSAFNGAGVSSYIADVANAREIVMIASGGLGEVEGGGPALNVVPKEGGNRISGTLFAAGVTGGMVDSNYTDELRARGLSTPGQIRKVWDFNLGIGGPVRRDRIWYYANLREEGSEQSVPGMFANANAGDPSKWTYVADRSRPAVLAASYRITALRLTAQVTPRNKFALFWDEQRPCEGGAAPGFAGDACRTSKGNIVYAGSTAPPTPSASPTFAPETAAYRDYGNRVAQAKWTAPVTNRLLLEAAYGTYRSRWGGKQIPGLDTEPLVRIVEQCARGCLDNGNIPGLTYRSGNWSSNVNWNTQWNAAVSFVTGTHSVKVGYQGALLYDDRKNFTNSEFLQYRVNNGIPDQLTLFINRFPIRQRVRSDAFYAQEQWTLGRVTLQGALRYDHAWSYFPEQTVGPVRFFPVAVSYPRTTGVEGYHDLWPRAGVAIDLFGTGRTSLKFNFGRYLEAAQNGGLFIALNPTGRLSTTTTRAWTDANGNYTPDCNLLNPAAQDLRASGGDVCGANTNANFGTQVFESTLDPELLSGWGVRTGDWQWGASIQQEVLPRVAVELGYQRRWLVNFLATDNRARTPEDHTEFGVNVPVDPRLPGGGGGVLRGLYNVTPAAAARLNDNFQTLARKIGEQSQATDSVNLSLTARPRAGLVLQGGFNTFKTDSDSCDLRRKIPESAPTNPWCDTSTGWVTRVTALGTYTIPKVDVQVAGTFRSDQGASLAANWVAPNSATVGLDRPFAGVAGQTITVNLVEPGTLYGDRVNQFDLRFAKILRFGRTRTSVGFDVYNVANAAPVLSYLQTFIPNEAVSTWLRPTSVLQSRFVKVSAQIDF
ncbi:MAG TPA: carboxypeptidase regulatory-like domain-containing protein [Vicinamibacterales bacterium]|nr:carboxypeptidase regulatory-like domain-containing protein [Vicinamibacterales bacterium]